MNTYIYSVDLVYGLLANKRREQVEVKATDKLKAVQKAIELRPFVSKLYGIDRIR